MTTDNSLKFELESVLRTFLGDAEREMGLQFHEMASEETDHKTYMVKDPASEKVLGVVTLNPFTEQANSCFSNSKDNPAVLSIKVNMNLRKPETGAVVLNANELGALFKVSSHALTALAAKKSHVSPLQANFVELPSRVSAFALKLNV